MLVAVISDIHENFHNLMLALEEIEKLNVNKIICLGDFINNGIAKVLAGSKIPVFAIWGNNDGDKAAITKTSMSKNSNLEMGFDTYDFLELDNRKLFLTHYPLLVKPMAKSGEYDAVFYGHDHKHHLEKIGRCFILNPGEISAHKTGEASFAIYDTQDNSAKIIIIKHAITTRTKQSEDYLTAVNIKFNSSKTHQY